MHIISIDPGMTTGIAHAYVDRTYQIVSPIRVQLETYDPYDGSLLILNLIEELRPDVVVMEDFITRTLAAELQPMTIIHIVKWEVIGGGMRLTERPGTLALQQPSERSVITDARLKRLELYQPGMPHANDAMRHLVVYSRKARQRNGPISK
jgi:hypothetical protein